MNCSFSFATIDLSEYDWQTTHAVTTARLKFGTEPSNRPGFASILIDWNVFASRIDDANFVIVSVRHNSRDVDVQRFIANVAKEERWRD